MQSLKGDWQIRREGNIVAKTVQVYKFTNVF